MKPHGEMMRPPRSPRREWLGHVVKGHRGAFGPPFGMGLGVPRQFYPAGEKHEFGDEKPAPDQGNAVDDGERRRVEPGRFPFPAAEERERNPASRRRMSH